MECGKGDHSDVALFCTNLTKTIVGQWLASGSNLSHQLCTAGDR